MGVSRGETISVDLPDGRKVPVKVPNELPVGENEFRMEFEMMEKD